MHPQSEHIYRKLIMYESLPGSVWRQPSKGNNSRLGEHLVGDPKHDISSSKYPRLIFHPYSFPGLFFRMDLFLTSARGVSRCETTSAMEPLLPMVTTAGAGDTLTASKLCGQSCGRHNFAPNNQPRPTCIVCKLQHTNGFIDWLTSVNLFPVPIFWFCM